MTATHDFPRRILHVDCDMFFVQVAKLEDPEGVGREDLVLVGGAADERGVVASASYAAREYGVRSAMPTSQALRLCPRALVVPVPREACARRSREVRSVLERFAPVVEAASIDEFYLDLSGTERLYGGEPLAATAERIRAAVWVEARIAVSIGGGSRRMVAKMATRQAKPAGVHVVPAGAEGAFMRGFELRQIPGVGPALGEMLRRRGLTTVEDALGYDRDALCRWLGPARGAWLHERIRGIDPTPVEPRGEPKSVSQERTFRADIESLPQLERQLVRLTSDLATELRRKGLRARTVRVYVRDRDFADRQIGRTMVEAMETERAIRRVALPMLRQLWERRPVGVRLLGVGASGLIGAGTSEQIRLLDSEPPLETERERSAARAADALRRRFGGDAVVPGGVIDGGDRV